MKHFQNLQRTVAQNRDALIKGLAFAAVLVQIIADGKLPTPPCPTSPKIKPGPGLPLRRRAERSPALASPKSRGTKKA